MPKKVGRRKGAKEQGLGTGRGAAAAGAVESLAIRVVTTLFTSGTPNLIPMRLHPFVRS